MAPLFFAQALAVAIAILLQNVWAGAVVSFAIAFNVYFCHVRLCKKKEAQHPLVPPQGKVDIYFPRTDIPRPIREDFRKVQEKKRRLPG